MESLGHLDFLAQRGNLETADTQDHQACWSHHFLHSKVLRVIQGLLGAMEKWEMLDHKVPQAPRVHQGTFVQAWWGPLDLQGFLVLRASQGQLAFLGDLTTPQENQGSQGYLAYLAHQGPRAPQDQM